MARIGRLLLMVGVLSWLAAPVQAQNRFQQGRQPPKMPEVPVSKSGVVEGVSVTANGVMIEVKTEDNQNWYLQVKPEAKVKVTGKGDASSLVKGQNVSFSASGGGKMEKISQLSVVTPLDQMGVGANAGPGPKPAAKPGKKPSGADLAGADAGGTSDGTGVVVRAPRSAAQPMIQLMVNGKRRTYELSEGLEVTFDLDGPGALTSVGPGAKIDFKGKGMGNLPQAVVDDIKIEVVPGESRKKPAHKLPHAKSKKGGDDQADAAGTDDEKPAKPARKTRKKPAKPDADDEKPADEKPADAGNAPAKDK